MTLIAGIKSRDGLILAADTEETITDVLRTQGEKIHIITSPFAEWKVVLAGSGSVDYVLMVKDLLQEKLLSGQGTLDEITTSIRSSVHEVWEDYAKYEAQVQINLLIGSFSSDKTHAFTVVSGAAIRKGRNIEAMGIGDATFRSLADRYIYTATPLSYLGWDPNALVAFVVYAALHAKRSVPGVGGMTRIVRFLPNGDIKLEKAHKIMAIQGFFFGLEENVRQHCFSFLGTDPVSPEDLLRSFNKRSIREFNALRKELLRIENDNSLG